MMIFARVFRLIPLLFATAATAQHVERVPVPAPAPPVDPRDLPKPFTPKCRPNFFLRAFFERGSSELTPEATVNVDTAALGIIACKPPGVVIEGSIDADEPPSLDRARAKAVRKRLIARGVPQALLRMEFAGTTKPLRSSPSVYNRRVMVAFEER